MTKVDAITKLMQDNDGLADWTLIYKEIEKYYPNAKNSKEWQAGIRGVLYRDIDKRFKKIGEGLYALINFDEENYLKQNNTPTISEKSIEHKIRVGQQYFRKNLLKNINICPFTKIKFEKLLIASHIKPWASCNHNEKFDINNGFVFTPTYDKLFDNGFISFRNNKELLISNLIDNEIKMLLKISSNIKIDLLPIENRLSYLEFHRDVVFKK